MADNDDAANELPTGAIPELTPGDDGLHPASDHWWETETAWFSFSIPERRIVGVHDLVRPLREWAERQRDARG